MEIEKGYLDFKKMEEDVLLFGNEEELYDLNRGRCEYTVVPATKEQFDLLSDPSFVSLLSSLDIKQ